MKFSALLIVPLLAACMKTVPAPSLASRPAETVDIDTPSPAPAPLQPSEGVQAALIAKLIGLARQGDAAFEKAFPATLASGPPQSEAWILAQNARSAAEAARGPTIDALSGLDAAIGDAIERGQATDALLVARAEVQSIYNKQVARLDSITR